MDDPDDMSPNTRALDLLKWSCTANNPANIWVPKPIPEKQTRIKAGGVHQVCLWEDLWRWVKEGSHTLKNKTLNECGYFPSNGFQR